MQEIEKIYNPAITEDKWYTDWLKKGYFHSEPDEREAFTIVIPPPNVTGILHMGHMLNNTIQDVLIRKARMEGKNACWVPGTDHASIATEAKVVQKLRKEGIKKSSLSREQFLEHAWEWKEKHGGIILEQLKKLGASCDWDRTRFTMDEGYYKAVIRVFVDFYEKGYIYRGLRMINWDCEAQTALSNEEVQYIEEGEKSILYSVKYAIEGSDEFLVIATQRPETIMGDTAIAVNPKDSRYAHLIGKHALVPFINRRIPVIADTYVDIEFGTGCLKVTPAHDPNDYEIGLRHQLPVIDTINLDGTLNEKCELPEFIGKDRFAVRDLMVEKLKSAGILVEEKEFITKIGRSERTQTVVEPKLSEQWFIRMKDISEKALHAVESDEIRIHPAKFKNTYRHWMENVRDWCISRQLWWGHRIPAWYLPNGEFIVAENETDAQKIRAEKYPQFSDADLKQDEDVLDTWASSWLWPMAVFDGLDTLDIETGKLKTVNRELGYYYPTAVLVTAPEILFFWVARMIIAGYEYMDAPPFKDVYLTGIVRDKLGRKMSKQLGNSPDPIDLIAQYSADGVRTGMLFSSPAGNDLPFDEALCAQGRNFANKIWNAFRLLKSWEIDAAREQPEIAKTSVIWFESRMSQAMIEINDHFRKFRISDALMAAYKLTWDDFCSWFLEMVKPEYGQPMDAKTYAAVSGFMENILQILHPFMPFITEEIWHGLKQRGEKDSIMNSAWPNPQASAEAAQRFEEIQVIITQIRNTRISKQIPMKEKLDAYLKDDGKPFAWEYAPVICKLGGLNSLEATAAAPDGTLTVMCGTREMYIPFSQQIDIPAELIKLQEQLTYFEGFLKSVSVKLSNERFVQNAKPEVVDAEMKKKADAEQKIKVISEQMDALKKMA